MSDELPSRRVSLRGTDLDGHRVTLSFSISKKLYKCPGCHGYIPVGSEHVLVSVAEVDGDSYYQHWHRDCARSIRRELRDVRNADPGDVGGGWGRPRRGRRRGV